MTAAMTIEEAKAVLASCSREELRDHAFGDVEIYWTKDGEEIAAGYFGRSSAVAFGCGVEFEGAEAEQLRDLGTAGAIARNDSAGPVEFRQGEVMPGLSAEGVLQELLKADQK